MAWRREIKASSREESQLLVVLSFNLDIGDGTNSPAQAKTPRTLGRTGRRREHGKIKFWVEKLPSTWVLSSGRRDSNPDPHLGKVRVFVRMDLADPQTCASVHPVSSPSTGSSPVVDRSTSDAKHRRSTAAPWGLPETPPAG